MRLIDADRLPHKDLSDGKRLCMVVFSSDIASAPTVDAVKVVRCKDCKYFELNHWDGPIITAHEICSKWGSGCKTDKDGYCFLGERKTDG